MQEQPMDVISKILKLSWANWAIGIGVTAAAHSGSTLAATPVNSPVQQPAPVHQVAQVPSTAQIDLPQTDPPQTDSAQTDLPQTDTLPARAAELDLDPALIQESPVLERWLEAVPDVRSEIRHDPSFRTRLRLGYSQFPANGQAAGLNVGVEDMFLGRTGLTFSSDYQRSFNGNHEAYGGTLQYYILPLGSAINVAPVIGYRAIDTDQDRTDGLAVGARLRFVPSRTGAADITLTQSWVAPGTDSEVGISTLSLGYAVTANLRLATDLEQQNSPARKDSRVAVVLEWMP